MTALALDVRELSFDEVGMISGGMMSESDAKLAQTVVTTIVLGLFVPLPVLVFAIVVFTPTPAY